MKPMNIIQILSIVGTVLGIMAHVGVTLIHKEVQGIWYIYPTWLGIFVIGTILNYFDIDEEHDHAH